MFATNAQDAGREANLARVLLVEDEAIVRLDLASELRGARYDVVEAANSRDALAILDSQPIDLLISDVVMPGPMDGVALAAHAREVNPRVKIIIVSGRFLELPDGHTADGFFAKPYGSTPVLKACRQLLSGRRPA
jgi:two-component system, response regulator PdtaR